MLFGDFRLFVWHLASLFSLVELRFYLGTGGGGHSFIGTQLKNSPLPRLPVSAEWTRSAVLAGELAVGGLVPSLMPHPSDSWLPGSSLLALIAAVLPIAWGNKDLPGWVCALAPDCPLAPRCPQLNFAQTSRCVRSSGLPPPLFYSLSRVLHTFSWAGVGLSD